MNWRDHIHSDPNVLLGKAVIKNTRITVELLVELFGKGWTEEMILESYPRLTRENVRAVFFYLNECLQQELYFPFKASA